MTLAVEKQYVVVARRYRPQSFSELVGQQQVSQALSNAINTNRVGHAYLFTGARGVGKTSTARILAKCLNCVAGPTPQPCGACDNCVSIATGDDVDVLEIDGASNRGIDEIRQLRSNVNIRPSRSRYKIYIIDEVHMLTTPAFNALLKTLEEPPEHVKFIFCTTDPEKIPITVLSRCQRFDFVGIATESIVGRLRQIVDAENAQVDDEALRLLARRAAGSMRDSQSLLEQLLAFGSERIAVDDVHALLGTANSGRVSQLLFCIAEKQPAGALAELDAALTEGAEPGQVIEQLAGALRDLMACAVGCAREMLHHTADDDRDTLNDLAAVLGVETILGALQVVDEALVRMRQSTHSRILAEAAVVRLCRLDQLDAIANLIGLGGSAMPARSAPASATRPASAAQKKSLNGSASQRIDPPQPQAPIQSPQRSTPTATAVASNSPPSAPGIGLTESNLAQIWERVLAELEGMTHLHASRSTSVAISGPNRLAIQFPQTYTSSKSFCERPQQREWLERALHNIVGTGVRVEFAVTSEEPQASKTNRPKIPQAQLRKQVASHPLVQAAAELFDATVVAVEPGRQVAVDDESDVRG